MLRLVGRPALRAPVLVAAFDGWNDAGGAATLAARHLLASSGGVPIAEIDPEELYDFTVRRPMVRLGDGGVRQIEWPRNDLYASSTVPGRDLVIGLCTEPHLRWRAYCDAFVELVRTLALERVVLLGAHLADVVYSRPVGVTGFSSAPESLARLGVAGSVYQGPTGIVGALADRLIREGVDTTSLWAGLPHYIGISPNPRGALALVRSVASCLDLRVDEEPLLREAADFEERIAELVSADPELSEYVKQLKRREFAQ